MSQTSKVALVGLCVAALPTSISSAGGLSRPNGFGPQNTSAGGTGATMVDDPTAVFLNPAAMTFSSKQVMVGGELVIAPRSYVPIDAAGVRGTAQTANAAAPLPLLGAIGRFENNNQPSRFTLGFLVMNTFGGKLSYPNTGTAAIDATQDAVVELMLGTSFEATDRLAIGASVRLGAGLFSSDVTELPLTAKVNSNGIGLGMTLGAMYRATDRLTLAASWRSPLTIKTTGSSTIEFPAGPATQLAEHVQRWPQQASIGASVNVSSAITLAVQADWTEWSRVTELSVDLPNMVSLSQVYPVAWNDNFSLRVGADLRVHRAIHVRAGGYFDSNAVPDRTIERIYLDNNKFGVSGGVVVRRGSWLLDVAADVGLPNSRTVVDNRIEAGSWPQLQNRAPGEHRGSIVTGELSVRRMF
jgi:long-chain fatty acid transport protein